MPNTIDTELVKSWLKRYRDRQVEYELQKERLERLICMAENVGSPKLTDMPRAPSPSMDKMSSYVQMKTELMENIGGILEYSKKTRGQIEAVLRFVKRAEERMIIRYRYVDGMEWKDIVDTLFCEKEDLIDKWESYEKLTYGFHGKAISDMAESMESHKGEEGVPSLVEISQEYF